MSKFCLFFMASVHCWVHSRMLVVVEQAGIKPCRPIRFWCNIIITLVYCNSNSLIILSIALQKVDIIDIGLVYERCGGTFLVNVCFQGNFPFLRQFFHLIQKMQQRQQLLLQSFTVFSWLMIWFDINNIIIIINKNIIAFYNINNSIL